MKSKVKIALAMIVRGDDKEAETLHKCLNNVSPFVDGIFITRTHLKGEKPNKRVKDVAEAFNANVSDFEWVKDFSAARNFNFDQVPDDYTHILWADADDVFRGLDKLRPTLEDYPEIDVFSIFYLYDFDKYKRPTVVHQKSQIIKNNKAVKWIGKLHEDFTEIRTVRRYFVKGIERLHMTNEDRIEIARKRNVEVAKYDAESSPDDPRSFWNLGNALFGNFEYKKSREALYKFLDLSQSDEEKYIVKLRLATVEKMLGNHIVAVELLQTAIGMKPHYPDAYHMLGEQYVEMGILDKARDSFLMGLTRKPPYYEIINYNPRDYDYNPLMALARVYMMLSRPDMALPCLEGAVKIHPQDDSLKRLLKNSRRRKRNLIKCLNI